MWSPAMSLIAIPLGGTVFCPNSILPWAPRTLCWKPITANGIGTPNPILWVCVCGRWCVPTCGMTVCFWCAIMLVKTHTPTAMCSKKCGNRRVMQDTEICTTFFSCSNRLFGGIMRLCLFFKILWHTILIRLMRTPNSLCRPHSWGMLWRFNA